MSSSNKKKKTKKPTAPSYRVTPLTVIFILTTLVCGGFHEYVSAICSIALTVIILVDLFRTGKSTIRLSVPNIAFFVLPFIYLTVSLWAVDTSDGLLGFVKFLPLSLMMLYLSNRPGEGDSLLDFLPVTAAAETLISAICMQIPSLTDKFSVSGRLAGFFQYSNTFAIFAVAAMLVTVTKSKLGKADFFCLAVLVFGLFYSGSRTALVIGVVFTLISLIINRNKKTLLISTGILVGIAVIAGAYALISGNYSTIGRFLSISLSESTFVGRLLYWKDGLSVFLQHPFGLGYLGWAEIQGSVQTGVYSVRFIHNDFLQILLDTGLPGLLVFLTGLGFALVRVRHNKRKLIVLLALCSHMLMDFDFQYLSIIILFAVLVFDGAPSKECSLHSKPLLCGATAVCCLFSAWLGLAQGLYSIGKYDISAKVCGFYTPSLIYVAYENSGSELSLTICNQIVSRGGCCSPAYGLLANDAYSNGDIRLASEYTEKQISCCRYDITLYEKYCEMLAVFYSQTDNEADKAFCSEKLLGIPGMLEQLKSETSELAYKIDDKPSFELSTTSLEYINRMKEVSSK